MQFVSSMIFPCSYRMLFEKSW